MIEPTTKMATILKRLLFLKNMRPVELARKIDLPPPTIHRFLTGKSKKPYPSSLQPIADFFNITPAQLLGEKPLPKELLQNETNLHEIDDTPLLKLPFYQWDELPHREQLSQDNRQCIPYLGESAQDAFATLMPNTSMAPLVLKDCTLIFTPEGDANDRSYILIKLADNRQYVFRQLLIDMEHRYLKALNPDLIASPMRKLTEEDTIIAVLQEARQVFTN